MVSDIVAVATAAPVAVTRDQIGAAIDWVYAHRDGIEWIGSILLTYAWAWVAHKQPAKVYDAGGLHKFVGAVIGGLFRRK